jgi:hypothetical protein
MNQLDEYDGRKHVWIAPDGYKRIMAHLAYMIKRDGHHKGRLVPNVHLGVPVTTKDFKDITKYTEKKMIGIYEAPFGTKPKLGMKKRATVETALNGSECAWSQTCVKQDIGLRSPLRYLKTPIYNKACMFKKNELVVNGSSTARVKPIGYYHIRSEANPSDVLRKHWGYSQVWTLLRCVLFWRGDTALLLTEQEEQEG